MYASSRPWPAAYYRHRGFQFHVIQSQPDIMRAGLAR